MNVTPTTIKAHVLTLTEPELRELIADLPNQSRFAGPLKASLNGAFDAEPLPTRRKAARGPKDTAAKEACPVCSKQVAYLNIHLKNKHPGYQRPS